MGFDIVPPDAIRAGTATDAYFLRTEETLDAAGRNPHVVAEITADMFPSGEFEVFAGVEDTATLLEGLDVDATALREGQLFDGGPVMQIEGRYREFARFETALLGFLSPASAYATRALTAKRAAGDATVLSFGARHCHPSTAAVLERAALVAGLDGFSHVAAGDLLGKKASGTMPHALFLCFGRNEQEAVWRAFDDAVDDDVPRVLLCDTFTDEVDEVVRAIESVDRVDSVRIDTTRSRRGDFAHIIREVQWALDQHGHGDVDVFVSGGITPETMTSLDGLVDGYGVGSFVTDANPVDFTLDIVEVDGNPIAKRGKLAGRKAVYRTPDGRHRVEPVEKPAPTDATALLGPLIEDGEIVRSFDVDAARTRCRRDAELVGF